MDGDIGVNAPPASSGTWRRSINTNEPMSLGSTHGSRPQNTTARAISTTACRGSATEGVTLEPHKQTTIENKTTPPMNKINSWKIVSLNVKGKRYSNRKSKYKDIATTLRLKKITILAIQETKLKEKEEENLMKENPRITIISNSNNSKAGVAFIINKDDIKENPENQWNHTIVVKGRVLTIQIRKNNQDYTIMNVYMPNEQKEKIETINKIREHTRKIKNQNNLIITRDFNFVTDALDRSPPHKDNNKISKNWTNITDEYNLIDGWQKSNKSERQFTYTQGKSLARINRIYTTRKVYESTAEWTIEENNGISDHQIITTMIYSMNLPYIGKRLWKLDIETIK